MKTHWQSNGIKRLIRAFGNSWDGLYHGIVEDSAIRMECIGLALLVPVVLLLPTSTLEKLLLILSMLLILFAELFNSAIESTVDRISLELHPLSKQAKDLSSAAVGVASVMCGLCWLVIAGPLLLSWLSSLFS